ncbi:MAG: ArsA-related P-loop ATPase [Actinomycetota bacterium]|nr:ArsA-related P-loop ATPase [Actinomycetota bacterium]
MSAAAGHTPSPSSGPATGATPDTAPGATPDTAPGPAADTGPTLAHHLATAEVLVCCGSGGVGKTTSAAALGLEACRLGRRAVVVTIDPAKRLADALGVPGGLGNDPVQLQVPGDGQLWAPMLDTATTFDGLVRANAADAEQAERILANGFYRNVAGSLSGTQEYMAAERLHALHNDPRFDLVIVDTPPTRNALDFLDAPGTIAKFIDHPLFKLLMMPTRRGMKVLNLAAQPLLRTIGRVVGGDVLADAVAFFQAFAGMETGFRRRADEVTALLSSDVTRFVLVASPRADTIEEACYFASRLAASRLEVGAVVVNRCTPTFGPPPARRPRAAARAALYDNLLELRTNAGVEREQAAALLQATGVPAGTHTTWVPTLPGDVHTLDALATIRGLLFD